MIKYQTPTRPNNITRYPAIGLIALLLSATSAFASDIKTDTTLAGKNIYMYGKLSSGEDVVATTIGDVLLSGEQALNAEDINTARQQFTLALSITPNHKPAQSGMNRASTLEKVTAKLNSGRKNEHKEFYPDSLVCKSCVGIRKRTQLYIM